MLVLSQIDYGLGILTLSATQLRSLDVIQNEGMRAILGCTKDTAAAAMRFCLRNASHEGMSQTGASQGVPESLCYHQASTAQ